ncbi:hypothetical protein FLM48_10245 [Shewanella sp. Scap07]|uniref:hypothetical protein n=1 Tax=Shewanella sp. Scap07 TaxID=2589987 RepID=UPI0015C199D9|nr:hypothetical protein [Shewanella sp. Scap07]QLE85423.1 hypothetical protein FLM48_10245 [Shewanella sp. Scap07]
MRRLSLLTLTMALTMTACGGGSDSSDSGEPTTPPLPDLSRCDTSTELVLLDTDSDISFLTEQNYYQGQPASIIAQLANTPSYQLSYQWQQVAGAPLSLTSVRSPVLNFEAPQNGSYQFSVTINSQNTNLTELVTIDVGQSGSALKVNADHQVVSGNGVSIRAQRIAGQVINDLSWCIAQGPTVGLDLSNPERPLFTAPQVNDDTIITLRASGTNAGVNYSDDVNVLVTQQPAITSPYFDEPVATTFAYNPNSPYAAVLDECVYSNQLNEPCNIATLPLIGQQSSQIDKQAIMDRLLVSHQWMGENFERFLTELDPHSDFATLLQSVTAIVISYDVRPSFYWVVTGAIYLDPNDLWLTPEQRDSINEAPDYRSGFSNELAFLMPWRYVKDNQYVSYIDDITQRNSRELQQLSGDLASLLYHELAHANDFFPRSIHGELTGPTLYDDYVRRNNDKALISDMLTSQYPLNSQELFDLADVRFRGESATETQKGYTPADITGFFSADRASDSYAYSTPREDAAMLFEEAMMSYRYGILRDVGVTDSPDTPSSANIIVDWGQRGRIGEAALENRSALVINQMMPELDGNALVSSLPAPIAMEAGKSWADNLVLISPQQAGVQSYQRTSAVSAQMEPPLQLSGNRH